MCQKAQKPATSKPDSLHWGRSSSGHAISTPLNVQGPQLGVCVAPRPRVRSQDLILFLQVLKTLACIGLRSPCSRLNLLADSGVSSLQDHVVIFKRSTLAGQTGRSERLLSAGCAPTACITPSSYFWLHVPKHFISRAVRLVSLE